jgi:hypothetical protein
VLCSAAFFCWWGKKKENSAFFESCWFLSCWFILGLFCWCGIMVVIIL